MPKKNYLNQFTESEQLQEAFPDWERFLIFWYSYKKPVGFWLAIRSWHKLSEQDKRDTFQHVDDYVRANQDLKFRKNPTTYLNQRAFEDEIIKREDEDPFRKIAKEILNKQNKND